MISARCLPGLALCGLLVFGAAAAFAASGEPSASVSAEVLKKVETLAFPPLAATIVADFSQSPERLRAKGLQAWLQSFDPYARWISAEAYQDILATRRIYTHGVGMDIFQNREGDIICIPYPDTPAQSAGIREGDILLAVDGNEVAGADVEDIGVLIRGRVNSPVALTVRHRSGETTMLTLQRRAIQEQDVVRTREKDFTRLRIYRFSPHTLAELTKALQTAGDTVVLDLRANTGGDLNAALACTALFLDKNALLVTSETRKGRNQRRVTKKGAYARTPRLVLWQDSLTASAAEICLAALLDNHRATSVGTVTFGKAKGQDVFTLRDKSLLKLTTEAFFRADGLTWQDTGLIPTIFVKDEEGTDAFVRQTRIILSGQTGR